MLLRVHGSSLRPHPSTVCVSDVAEFALVRSSGRYKGLEMFIRARGMLIDIENVTLSDLQKPDWPMRAGSCCGVMEVGC